MMKFTLKKRFHSYKDYSSRSFKLGAISFPDSLLFLTDVLNQDTEDCTAFQAVAVRDSEAAPLIFEPNAFWDDELAFCGVSSSEGFDLGIPAAVGVKTGFLPTNNPLHTAKASAYIWIHPQEGLDMFDTIRSVVQTNQRPVSVGMDWYNEYTMAPQGVLSDNGLTLLGGHAIKCAGFKTINGIPYLVLQNSWGVKVGDGGLFYMPRELANKAFLQFGAYYWIDSTNTTVQTLGLLSALYANVLALLQNMVS